MRSLPLVLLALACSKTEPASGPAPSSSSSPLAPPSAAAAAMPSAAPPVPSKPRNVLIYVSYSDRVIEGSPKNSISTVPIMGWQAP